MRNVIPVLAAGALLCGCLSKSGSNVDGNTSADSTGNNAPRITGSAPSSVKYGNRYEFLPTATDADGDSLTFDVSNLPKWATFDTSTGRVSGQPTLADVGHYDGIVVSVSDGMATSSLPRFAISVNETALGSITLSWIAPTRYMDGSALTDLAGFIIYYGKTSGTYDHQIRIDNPSVSVYVVDDLDPTTYYFAATAFNATGVESFYSSEIALAVN